MLSRYDVEAAKIIDDFLPDKLFDAHMHISHLSYGFDEYYEFIKPFTGDRKVLCNGITFPDPVLKEQAEKSVEFLCGELERYPGNVGEVMVFPWDAAGDIEKRLVHSRIRGLKCYHVYAERGDTAYADIGEYLPESAWQVANSKKMPITLHLVKDEALSHPENLNYITDMARRYPDAVLILAHGARSFAPWTVFDAVDCLKPLENVWFDFSALCEVTSMLYILKKIGVSRCMWGTDFPVCKSPGKAVSVGKSFYWIGKDELECFAEKSDIKWWHVITEEFMAMRQTAILADLNYSDIEDLFFNNASGMFRSH